MTLMERRRALMSVKGSNIPQLIPNQTHTFPDGTTVTITGGHHIKLDFASSISLGMINISDMSKNGSVINNDGQNVNNIADTLVSFPEGSSVTLTATNFTKTPKEILYSSSEYTAPELAIGFRKRSGNVTAIGRVGFKLPNNIVQSNTVSFESDTGASCLFVYLSKIKANVSIEFDVGLTIDGKKVI